MIRTAAFSLLLVFASAAMAMDPTDAATVPALEIQENLVAEMSISSRFSYMGASRDREKIEKIYGRSFPLNTIFVQVRWRGEELYDEHNSLVPDFVPYDYVRHIKEGESFVLSINGKKHTVFCKQQRRGNLYRKDSFESLLSLFMKNFADRATWYLDGGNEGETSLIHEQVIDPTVNTKHGKNRSPFVQIEK